MKVFLYFSPNPDSLFCCSGVLLIFMKLEGEVFLSKPDLMFYNDGRHPLIYMYEPPIEKEEYEAAVDELAGTPVEALMFCLGDGRTVLHDTRVGELWGHNVNQWDHLVFHRTFQNARHLIKMGHDPLRLICDRAHAKGILVYPTLLVQQGRTDEAADVSRCSDFRLENTGLEIGGNGDLEPDFPGLTCLDFKHEMVRDERFALIEEILSVYPVDGFELQLNYLPYYFHPNEVQSGLEIMTAWIKRVYQAVKKSDSNRELAIRIPSSIKGCLQIGLEVEEWIRQGIVDVIIGQTFSGPELHDPTIDFRSLVAAVKSTNCRIHAALQSHVDSDRLSEATIEMIRAAASNYWAQGVDGLYLSHWFNSWPYQASFYEKLRELPHPDIMASKDKTYCIPTKTFRYPEPKAGPGTRTFLPVDLEVGRPVDIRFQVSDDLKFWSKYYRVHKVLLRIRVMNIIEGERILFKFNGLELPVRCLRKINEIYRMSAPRYRTGWGYWFVFRLDQENWPIRGFNSLEMTLVWRNPNMVPQVYLRDVELEIKYLMGKNFNRGQDPDLGHYELLNP